MTDLVRRALLGDRQAQEECTRRGTVLPCPFCGTQPRIVCSGPYKDPQGVYSSWYVQCAKCGTVKHGSHDYFTFCEETGEFVRDGNSKKEAINKWNTRPSPPIGRCGECGAHVDNKCQNTGYYTSDSGFCNDFVPKED